ncbi:fimbria/pilus outer membrane usher protein [Pseudomonas sp. JH-2]|uniref:fimbria/pilus outer membrane usher protein n=1 Tax=Pseudomonas sp. JH-2 TaxID=3114998 RepID=UPI002E25CEFF|nr:fimbria/pilus outer membrane usher protein [Pseudomonas sp. JH-2]
MAFPFIASWRSIRASSGATARLQVPLLLLCSAVAMTANGGKPTEELLADSYVFDSSLFRGGPLSQATLSRFNKVNAVAPGTYKVDVFINNRFVDRADVQFVSVADGQVQPCLTPALLENAGVEATNIAGERPQQDANASCLPLGQTLKGSSSQLDMARLRLDLSVPQSLMKRVPRGYVNPSDLDAGNAIGFVNYIGNYYHVSYTGDYAGSQDSAYLSLNGGLNLGMWQYRQQSNLTYDRDYGSHWHNIRSYVQRPLPSMDSQLSLGQTYTTGRFFSGLSYTGINLSSDDRMLPDSMRGYAPTVRGVARTNARVSIRQNGQEIYQTTVAPGPFEITDLYPTSYNGDLDVEVTEADGSVSRFSVPFSAVPESLRPGVSRYSVSLGRTRDVGEDSLFSDLTYQRGLSNTITTNSGVRIADGYQALMLGSVYASSLGAFGLDLTYSRADLPDTGYLDGWMAHLSYSRTFQPTNTTLSIAGYRYSTSGYRDLGDVLGVRDAARDGYTWQSSTYQQQSRFEVSVNQSLGRYGNLFLSGSTQNYRDGRDRDTQLQLGYGNAFSNGVSLNLSVARQRIGGYDSRVPGGYDQNDPSNPGFGYNGSSPGSIDTITTLSVSLPLGNTANPRTPTLSSSYSHSSSGGSQYQSTVSGMADQDQTLSYSMGVTRDQEQRQTVWNGNLQKRLPTTSLGLSASRGEDYWQAAGNAQGALAVHSGGVTFGPYLGDTFALVEAKGATGAKVLNSQSTTIDGNGYALVPAITPYRYNSVALDPEGMEGKAELEDGEQRVAPYAGAAVKVTFKTRTGNALLIRTHQADGQNVPLGAEAYDESGSVIGMVGQGGQVYVRSDKPKGRLTLRWGDDASERCELPYDTAGKDLEQVLIKLEATCTRE